MSPSPSARSFFKLPESTWSGVVVDESRWVLDVGRDSSFVRKIKATQKMDARGVCMLCVVSVNLSGWLRSLPLIREGVFSQQQSFQFNSPEKILIKIHRTRKLLKMESRIAVAVSVLPWVRPRGFT